MKSKSFKKLLGIALICFIVLSSLPMNVSATSSNKPTLSFRAHVQTFGWLDFAQNSNIIGTTGKSKRMEALEINIDAPAGVQLKYRAHVQTYGWMNWVTADNTYGTNFVGTMGKSKRVEAIQIVLEGHSDYTLKYRAHVQKYGWMNWVIAGDSIDTATFAKNTYAGTQGESKRIEALEIVLVKKPESNLLTDKSSNAEVENKAEAQPNLTEVQTQNETQQKPTEVQTPTETQSNFAQQQTQAEPQPEVAENNSGVETHTHTFTQWETITEPTCNHYGVQSRKCSTCGATEEKNLYVSVPHQLVGAPELDIPATCTKAGAVYSKCSVCGDLFFHIVQPLGDHIWDTEYTIDTPATCTTAGSKSIHCSRCDATKEQVTIQATGHDLTRITKEATCTENGAILEKCTKCDYEKVVSSTPKVSHKFETLDDKISPTCVTAGKEASQRCTVCGTIVEGSIIKALGHDYKYITDSSACIGTYTEYKCARCGFDNTDSLNSLKFGKGHNWVYDSVNNYYYCADCEDSKPDAHGHYENTWWWAWRNKPVGAIWMVGFTCDNVKCYGFNGANKILESRRGEKRAITMIAPEAREGYVFDGWYDLATGQKVTATKSTGDGSTYVNGTTINVGWKDMYKGFEARYTSK